MAAISLAAAVDTRVLDAARFRTTTPDTTTVAAAPAGPAGSGDTTATPTTIAAPFTPDRPADELGPTHDDHGKRRAHGVLRKLDTGHFNPVAELNHRIRLADELTARRQERGRDALEDGAEAIVGSVRDALAGAVESGDLSTDDAVGLAHALEDALAATLAPHLGGSGPIDLEALAGDLAGVASGLAARTNALIPVPADPADDTPATTALPASASTIIADGEDAAAIRADDAATLEPSTTVAAIPAVTEPTLAETIADAFSAAVGGLLERLDALLAPAPAPAAPHGNGAAYERLAARYAALHADTALDLSA